MVVMALASWVPQIFGWSAGLCFRPALQALGFKRRVVDAIGILLKETKHIVTWNIANVKF